MSSTLNKGKSVDTESFIRTLKNKIYKYMTIAKNVYTDKLDHIVKKYNNKYHKLLKNETCWCKIKHIYWL